MPTEYTDCAYKVLSLDLPSNPSPPKYTHTQKRPAEKHALFRLTHHVLIECAPEGVAEAARQRCAQPVGEGGGGRGTHRLVRTHTQASVWQTGR